jgi:hypothetical protein
MHYVPTDMQRSAVPAEFAQEYARTVEEAPREGVALAWGGTLEHFQEPAVPRARFRDDSHGKHGRQPQRPKGSNTVRRTAA